MPGNWNAAPRVHFFAVSNCSRLTQFPAWILLFRVRIKKNRINFTHPRPGVGNRRQREGIGGEFNSHANKMVEKLRGLPRKRWMRTKVQRR